MRTRIKSEPGFSNVPLELSRWRRKTAIPHGPEYRTDTSFIEHMTAPSGTSNRVVTSDENHHLHKRSILNESLTDLGGPFDQYRFGRRVSPDSQTIAGPWDHDPANPGFDGRYHYNGPVYAIDPRTVPVRTNNDLRQNLKPLGTTAIARCKPTNHVSNLATDLVELYRREIPRLPGLSTWTNRTLKARDAGDEYLNVQFGWEPLLSDIRNASYAAANSARLLKAYEDNSGKPVRRRYMFPVEESETSKDMGQTEGYFPYWNLTFSSHGFVDGSKSLPHLIKTTRTRRETWFSGCFTYYLPTDYIGRTRLLEIREKFAHLYGLEITPSVVFQVAPWTWAADWFSNMGQVVSNASDWATDGLVMYYGYLMQHIVEEVTYSLSGPTRFYLMDGGHANASPVVAYYESKQRIKASPFGFEVDFTGLSLRQLAISLALGITRF